MTIPSDERRVQGVTSVKTGDVQSATVEGAALFATDMGRSREGLQKALVGSKRVEYFRAPRLPLVHDARVLELLDQSFLALVVSVTHLKHLFTREHVPFLAEPSLRKLQEILRLDEIHKRITDVTPVLEVHAEIEKVDASRTNLVDVGNQVLVAHFVGDILDHDRRPGILTTFDP